jgi:autotransporter-associated beta strand protein
MSAGSTVTNYGTVAGGAVTTSGTSGNGVALTGGGTLVNYGTIRSGSAGSATAGVGVVATGAAATLQNGGADGNGTISGGVTMDSFANQVTLHAGSAISGNLNTGTSTSATLTLTDPGSGGSQAYSGAVTGTTSFSGALVKEGSGTWTLDTALAPGSVAINAGTLAVGHASAIGSSGTISFGGGTLQASASNTTDYSDRFSNAADQQYKLDTNGQNVTLASALTSSGGSVTKLGSGTLVLSGSNSFNGALTISGGIVSLANNAAVAGSSGINLGAGTGLSYTGAAATIDRNISVTGGTGTLRNTGGATLALSGNLSKNGTVLSFAGGSFSITGVISGASANSDLIVDGAVVALNNTNTYNGPTYLRNAGALAANVAGAMPTSSRSAVIMDDTGTGSSALTHAASQQIASLTGAASSSVSLAAETSLTIGDSTGNTTFAGVISGSGGLIKDGASTQTLSGANTYTGGTTISAGTLDVNGAAGSLTATSAVNISGGTLLLSGSAADRISDAASISLGSATDSQLQLSGAVTETLGDLTLYGVGARVIDFGSGSGVLTLASLTAASPLSLQIWNWSGTTGTGGGADQLIISSGSLGGSLSTTYISFYSDSGTTLLSSAAVIDADSDELVPVVCFLAGTLIATPTGEQPIETLQPGDLINTAEGPRPVRFLARSTRSIDQLQDLGKMPIRINQGALGALGPAQDTFLSPSHAIHFAGSLVEAAALINGTSIQQLYDWPEASLTYYNIELERHGLITANGLLVESYFANYRNNGFSRDCWDNYHDFVARYGAGESMVELPLPRIPFARQIPMELRLSLQLHQDQYKAANPAIAASAVGQFAGLCL